MRWIVGPMVVSCALLAFGCDKGEGESNSPNDDPAMVPSEVDENAGEPEAPAGEPAAAAAASPWIDIHNGCSDTVGYCVKHPDGREVQTSMNGSSHQAYQIAPGGAVRSRDGDGRCDAVLFEVSADTGDSDFYLCDD